MNELPEDTDDIRDLTIDVAKQLCADLSGSSLSLCGVASLSAEAAETLCEGLAEELEGVDLHLDGLQTLSPEVARALSSNLSGGNLYLDRLSSISREVAAALAQDSALESLQLRGLRSLSPETAAELSGMYLSQLDLSGLRQISDATAEEFGKAEVSRLRLDGLESLPASAATALATAEFCELSLGGVTRLSVGAAAALAKLGINSLRLDGLLPELSAEAAQALARFPGQLHVNNVVEPLLVEARVALGRVAAKSVPPGTVVCQRCGGDTFEGEYSARYSQWDSTSAIFERRLRAGGSGVAPAVKDCWSGLETEIQEMIAEERNSGYFEEGPSHLYSGTEGERKVFEVNVQAACVFCRSELSLGDRCFPGAPATDLLGLRRPPASARASWPSQLWVGEGAGIPSSESASEDGIACPCCGQGRLRLLAAGWIWNADAGWESGGIRVKGAREADGSDEWLERLKMSNGNPNSQDCGHIEPRIGFRSAVACDRDGCWIARGLQSVEAVLAAVFAAAAFKGASVGGDEVQASLSQLLCRLDPDESKHERIMERAITWLGEDCLRTGGEEQPLTEYDWQQLFEQHPAEDRGEAARCLIEQRREGLREGRVGGEQQRRAEAVERVTLRASARRRTSLTSREARLLVDGARRTLRFDHLDQLEPEVAEALVRHKGKLGFDGSQALCPEVAAILARHRGPALHLNGLREITLDAAAALARHQKELFLVGLESISEEVAEVLGRHPGRVVVACWCRVPSSADGLSVLQPGDASLRRILRGLVVVHPHMGPALAAWSGVLELWVTELSDSVAQHLAGHRGDLHLPSITELSDVAAAALAAHEGALYFRRLSVITEAGAAALLQHNGDVVVPALRDATSLTVSHISLIVRDRTCRILSLRGMASLSIEVAQVLAAFEGRLDLSGLQQLSGEAAEVLAQHVGELLLNGLTTLSEPSAQSLSRHDGGLHLDGIVDLSPEAATFLCRLPGCLNMRHMADRHQESALPEGVGQLGPRIGPDRDEWLKGLTSLTVAAARSLMPGASWIGCHGYQLKLDGMQSISADVVEALARHPCYHLHLDGLESLSIDVADALSLVKGATLSLDGLTEISDEAAAALAPVQAWTLGLNGLKTISASAAEALRQRQKAVQLSGLESISDEAAKVLAGFGWFLRTNDAIRDQIRAL